MKTCALCHKPFDDNTNYKDNVHLICDIEYEKRRRNSMCVRCNDAFANYYDDGHCCDNCNLGWTDYQNYPSPQ